MGEGGGVRRRQGGERGRDEIGRERVQVKDGK